MILAGFLLLALDGFFSLALGAPNLTPTPTQTLTPTFCPRNTPESIRVEPVQSPTNLLTQTIAVGVGYGELVTVVCESGAFTLTGNFSSYGRPALVTISLLPNTNHHLTVSGRVRRITSGGCEYGGYTLTTRYDRLGNPLVIEQIFDGYQSFFPLILFTSQVVEPQRRYLP